MLHKTANLTTGLNANELILKLQMIALLEGSMRWLLHCSFFVVVLFISGCGARVIKNMNPQQYESAVDYAEAIVDASGCVGRIDGIFFSAGDKFIDHDGRHYISHYAASYCPRDSFISAMKQFCVSKGNEFDENTSWCKTKVGRTPVFYVNDFSILEKSTTQTNKLWEEVAERKGFLSNRVKARIENEKLMKEVEARERQKRRSIRVDAKIGDILCYEDYDVPDYQYPTVAYYKAYVEDKKNGRYKLRIFWHGGDGFVINDVKNNNIVWVSQSGWFHCE